MQQLSDLLDRLEELVAEMESLDDPERQKVFELLDGLDRIHRLGLAPVVDVLDDGALGELRKDAAAAWLLDAYGVGVDEVAEAERALEEIRPYVHSHGGRVEVLEANQGVVRVKLEGSCEGCSASSVTLKEGIERALRDHWAGFVALEAEEDDAEPHPPPGPTLLQIQPPRASS